MKDNFLFYNFHPPEEVRVFTTPKAAVKRWDSSVLVFDVRIGNGILRKYSFTKIVGLKFTVPSIWMENCYRNQVPLIGLSTVTCALRQ
jgi:hypothetical protein